MHLCSQQGYQQEAQESLLICLSQLVRGGFVAAAVRCGPGPTYPQTTWGPPPALRPRGIRKHCNLSLLSHVSLLLTWYFKITSYIRSKQHNLATKLLLSSLRSGAGRKP